MYFRDLLQLRNACRGRDRDVRLLFLPPEFERRRENTTRYDTRTRRISWMMRLVFPHCRRSVLLQSAKETTRCDSKSDFPFSGK